MGACKNEPPFSYVYEQNPRYTYMGMEFYGQYYDNIPNYVFSFMFLSDGMLNEDSTKIAAPGQYLYIEDFFVPEERLDMLENLDNDIILTERVLFNILRGEYKVSEKVGGGNYGNALTLAPGEYFKVDSAAYILGARIMYYEENDLYSTRKLITGGSFNISMNGVSFNFLTEDGLCLKGFYKTPQEQAEKKTRIKYSSERKSEQLK